MYHLAPVLLKMAVLQTRVAFEKSPSLMWHHQLLVLEPGTPLLSEVVPWVLAHLQSWRRLSLAPWPQPALPMRLLAYCWCWWQLQPLSWPLHHHGAP
jgi:hypothetical protein